MTGDARMPTTGSPIANAAFAWGLGISVATGLLLSRGAFWAANQATAQAKRAKELQAKAAKARGDRRLVRAKERAARHEQKAQAWDEFGCDLWDWE